MRVTIDERNYDPEHGLDRSHGPRYAAGERFIVKVQLPLAGNEGLVALVYDQQRRIEYAASRKESEDIARHVRYAAKSYWYATQDAAGEVTLGLAAPWQRW